MIFDFSIDRGGTFTDMYCEVTQAESGEHQSYVTKLLSVDPLNYADAPTEGIRRILSQFGSHGEIPRDQQIPTDEIRSIRMGTTVATNALLERKGDNVALFISTGLKDTLEIGNMSRPKIFDLEIKTPTPVYKRVIEVQGGRLRPLHPHEKADERAVSDLEIIEGSNGQSYVVEEPLDIEATRRQLADLKAKGTVTSLAIVLMHSYAHQEMEMQIEALAKEVGFEQISLSSKVMPRVKLVERGQTCCVDAYLNPHIFRYLASFVKGFDEQLYSRVQVFFMQSDGGLAPLDKFTGSKAILSGPAGGVVGYSSTSRQSQERSGATELRPVIGFDMGGTSTDVSRYHLDYEHIFETEIAGTSIQAPQLNISTVAAGGGSRLTFDKGMYRVGPESTSADPGPVCYRKKGGMLAVTDANLILGRLLPEHFPKIFGPSEDQPLDKELAISAMQELTDKINEYADVDTPERSVYDVALGFIRVANEAMSRPIRSLTQNRGFNPKSHILDVFGGAGAQHACAIAKGLGISTVYIHKHCGILSAYGLGLADVVQEKEEPMQEKLADGIVQAKITSRFTEMQQKNESAIIDVGFLQSQVESKYYLNLRYVGTNTSIMIEQPDKKEDPAKTIEQLYTEAFENQHCLEFGFNFEARDILIDNVRVRSEGKKQTIRPKSIEVKAEGEQLPEPHQVTKVYFEVGGEAKELPTNVYPLDQLKAEMEIAGPAIILNKTSTVVIEPYWLAKIDIYGNVEISADQSGAATVDFEQYEYPEDVPCDPIDLSIFGHRFMSIAEQMGTTLQRTSASTNIKERLDFSCALFDPEGCLVANAPHVPVHLGSMQEAVAFQVKQLGENWREGEVILTNHPTAGGTHLPDMTIITPVYSQGQAIAFVASRGHHSDIGGIQPGSMPAFSKHIEEEGAQFVSFKIVKDGAFNEAELVEILTNQPDDVNPLVTGTRNLKDNIADFKAQIAANKRGIELLTGLIEEYSLVYVQAYMFHIQRNAELAVRQMLRELSLSQGLEPVATIYAEDLMDDGSTIRLAVTIDREQGCARFDFQGTDPEMYGNCNAPRSITQSAIIYCMRCLVVSDIPLNQGCLKPIDIHVPQGCFLNPSAKAAVVGGNVLTSQRVTDVILRAFSACAASQGCMNNFTFGDDDFGYYETIGGGAGAGSTWQGQSGIQVHMTNTRITDPEIMELRYPVVVRQFTYRQGSGGQGQFSGGDGIVREVEFLKDGIHVGLLTERRTVAPYGLNSGHDGARGKNLLILPDGRIQSFGAKNSASVSKNTRIRILTPGGGGYGDPSNEQQTD